MELYRFRRSLQDPGCDQWKPDVLKDAATSLMRSPRALTPVISKNDFNNFFSDRSYSGLWQKFNPSGMDTSGHAAKLPH